MTLAFFALSATAFMMFFIFDRTSKSMMEALTVLELLKESNQLTGLQRIMRPVGYFLVMAYLAARTLGLVGGFVLFGFAVNSLLGGM